ncbi:hypothetical protein BLOT_012577 [Blomia tropicalis]|nr:hypothetical protein BLOT_012577 [Blomia tropicalis]
MHPQSPHSPLPTTTSAANYGIIQCFKLDDRRISCGCTKHFLELRINYYNFIYVNNATELSNVPNKQTKKFHLSSFRTQIPNQTDSLNTIHCKETIKFYSFLFKQ